MIDLYILMIVMVTVMFPKVILEILLFTVKILVKTTIKIFSREEEVKVSKEEKLLNNLIRLIPKVKYTVKEIELERKQAESKKEIKKIIRPESYKLH